MSVIVSDTSPIRALDHLKLTSLLKRLYGEVLIPPSVAEELCAPDSALPPLEWTSIPGLRVQAPTDTARQRCSLMSERPARWPCRWG